MKKKQTSASLLKNVLTELQVIRQQKYNVPMLELDIIKIVVIPCPGKFYPSLTMENNPFGGCLETEECVCKGTKLIKIGDLCAHMIQVYNNMANHNLE